MAVHIQQQEIHPLHLAARMFIATPPNPAQNKSLRYSAQNNNSYWYLRICLPVIHTKNGSAPIFTTV